MPITYVEIDSKKITKRRAKLPWKKILVGGAVFVLFVFIIGSVYLYPRVRVLVRDSSAISQEARVLQAAIKKQDIQTAKKANLELRISLQKSQKDLANLKFLGWVPFLNNYYHDAVHGVRAGILATKAGEIVADSILPFGDILGLKGVKSNQKAEEKVEVLVTKVFPALSTQTDDLSNYVKQIRAEIDQIKPDRYPKALTMGGINIHQGLIDAQGFARKAQDGLPFLKDATSALPSILGYKKEKTYLIWFQNDKELRPTGGFISAYGIARVKDGKLLDVTSDDIYSLDLRLSPFEAPPAPLQKYLLLKIFPIRDTNLSPDFKLSAQKFESFYDRIKSMPKIDGIVAVDTELVRKFLEITGPIKVAKYNETFSAEPHPVYKIPDVVYKLELYAEVLLSGQRERKGLVGDLMDEMLKKLFAAPPEKFPTIFETFVKSAESKNILFYFHEDKPRKLVEELNYAGRIKNTDGDYLHVNNANFAGLKGNLYIKSAIDQDIVIAADGSVTKKVKVTLRNTEKADGWLNSVYQNWMRLYVPKGSKLIKKEVYADFAEKEELGKTVWESFSRTLPLNFSETTLTYTLPFKVKKGQIYKLLIQKQGGTTDPHVITKINGRKLFEFDLKKDTTLEFKV